MENKKIITTCLGLLAVGLFVSPLISGVTAVSSIDPSDIANYQTVVLYIQGNYTYDPDLSLGSLRTKTLQSMELMDNFLGYNAEGLPVMSFNVGIKSIEDTNEMGIMESWYRYNLRHQNFYASEFIEAEQSNLVENTTTVDGADGESYLYDTSFAVDTYPYLWIKRIHSSQTGTNTTVKVSTATQQYTLFNDFVAERRGMWWNLADSVSAGATLVNVSVTGSYIDAGVYVFQLGSSKTYKDTRHYTCYVAGDNYNPSVESASEMVKFGDTWFYKIEGNELPFNPPMMSPLGDTIDRFLDYPITDYLALHSDLDFPVDEVIHQVVSWGEEEELEDELISTIALMDQIDVGEIDDYAVTTATVINSLPEVVTSVCKDFAVDVASTTSVLSDFVSDLSAKTIAGSHIVCDTPPPEPTTNFFTDIWEWVKENSKNIFDNTKAAVVSFLKGKNIGEYGADVTEDITNADGEIDQSPTVINTMSNWVYRAMGWIQENYWVAIIGATFIVGVVIILIMRSRK